MFAWLMRTAVIRISVLMAFVAELKRRKGQYSFEARVVRVEGE